MLGLRRIRSMSVRTELLFVSAVAFGWPLLGSLAHVLGPGRDRVEFSAAETGGLVLVETVVLAILAAFLRLRDARTAWFGARPCLADTARGVGLAGAAYLVYWPAALLLWRIWPPSARGGPEFVVGSMSLGTMVAVSVVNPIFEEGLLLGYLARRLHALRGPRTAIAVTVALRMLYHTYQGLHGVLFVGLLGGVLSVAYLRQGRLWPAIVAHGLLDFLPMLLAR